MLFTAGTRPAAISVRELGERCGSFSVSFDPSGSQGKPSREEPRWLELLSSGLTFDLSGLAPGPPARDPPRGRGLTVEEGAYSAEAVTLRPGPHLASASGMVPVARMLAAVAASLCELEGVTAVAWHPARCWSAPDIYRDSIGRWLDGGVFPGLTLTALSLSPDRGLHSEGLALFTGQELRLEPEIVEDRAEAAKLALRLLDLLVERGRIGAPETLVGPDRSLLRLEPSENGRFVRVCRG